MTYKGYFLFINFHSPPFMLKSFLFFIQIIYSAYLIGYFSTSNPFCCKYKHTETYKDPKEMRVSIL